MTWCMLTKTRTLQLPSWWHKPSRTQLHRSDSTFLQVLCSSSKSIFPMDLKLGGMPSSPRELEQRDALGATGTPPSWAAPVSKLGGWERRENTDLCCFFLYVCHAPPLLPSMKFNLSPPRSSARLRADTQLWVLSRESKHMVSYQCWDTRLLLLPDPYPAPGQKINTPAAILSANDHRDGTGEQHRNSRPAAREKCSPPGQDDGKFAIV